VLGAQHSSGSGGSGGVLGATAKLGSAATSGKLPFTGFPLWAAGVIALGLIGLGLAFRRTGRLGA
jgi:hypothetical protein